MWIGKCVHVVVYVYAQFIVSLDIISNILLETSFKYTFQYLMQTKLTAIIYSSYFGIENQNFYNYFRMLRPSLEYFRWRFVLQPKELRLKVIIIMYSIKTWCKSDNFVGNMLMLMDLRYIELKHIHHLFF